MLFVIVVFHNDLRHARCWRQLERYVARPYNEFHEFALDDRFEGRFHARQSGELERN